MAVAAFKILDDLRQTLDDGIVLEGLEIAAAEAARIIGSGGGSIGSGGGS